MGLAIGFTNRSLQFIRIAVVHGYYSFLGYYWGFFRGYYGCSGQNGSTICKFSVRAPTLVDPYWNKNMKFGGGHEGSLYTAS